MIYLDASALVTFVIRRENVHELEAYLASQVSRTCTSTIGMIETVRTCDRAGSYPHLMRRLIYDHDEIPVTSHIRDAAANVPGSLRALDAIHVASAQTLGASLIALVTYDNRMADAARDAGLPVVMPGME